MLTTEEIELASNLREDLGINWSAYSHSSLVEMLVDREAQLAKANAAAAESWGQAKALEAQLAEQQKLLDRLYRVGHCGSVDSFLACDDEVKRGYFAMMVEESTENKKLREQLAEVTQERDGWIAEFKSVAEQHAESQAREQQLRELLNLALCHGAFDQGSGVIKELQQALALPHDNTALRQWGAKLLDEIANSWESGGDLYSRSFARELRRKANELRSGK